MVYHDFIDMLSWCAWIYRYDRTSPNFFYASASMSTHDHE